MIITRTEVKTIYSINITFEDFLNAYDDYRISPVKNIGDYEEAFEENEATNNGLYDKLKKYFKNLMKYDNRFATLNFIIKEHFNFDGIINYGYYSKHNKSYVMEVFCYGDKINN